MGEFVLFVQRSPSRRETPATTAETYPLLTKNVFKVYQVKPSESNSGFFKVVKAYFIYDRREEHVYQEFEAQLDAMEREEAANAANNPNPTTNQNPNAPISTNAITRNRPRTHSQDSPQISTPPERAGIEASPALIRSSLREWVLKSRNLTPADEQRDNNSANRDSKNNSEEMNEVGGRKRVESFEIDFGGLSRSNSSASIGDKIGNENKINEKLFLRSFDSLNKEEGNEKTESKDDSSATQITSLVLPPVRPRVRSYESYRGNSPYLPPKDKNSLNPIDERDDEHHND